MGENKKISLFEFVGIIVSFVSNLIPSAIGCNNPNGPTTLGPFLN